MATNDNPRSLLTQRHLPMRNQSLRDFMRIWGDPVGVRWSMCINTHALPSNQLNRFVVDKNMTIKNKKGISLVSLYNFIIFHPKKNRLFFQSTPLRALLLLSPPVSAGTESFTEPQLSPRCWTVGASTSNKMHWIRSVDVFTGVCWSNVTFFHH